MIIYLAGPIRPKGIQTLEGNIAAAKDAALTLWQMGYVVICPHANSDLPVTKSQECVEVKAWLQGDLDLLARCDAMVVLPGWETSDGTRGEIKFAKERSIPITYWPDTPPIPPTETKRPNQVKGYIDLIMNGYRIHLQKNADYSPANILGTGEIGLVTRTWDKMARLMNLFGFRIEICQSHYESPIAPKCEAIEDTIMDLSVYAVIWQLVRKGVWGR
jgi:hypothetical protein